MHKNLLNDVLEVLVIPVAMPTKEGWEVHYTVEQLDNIRMSYTRLQAFIDDVPEGLGDDLNRIIPSGRQLHNKTYKAALMLESAVSDD